MTRLDFLKFQLKRAFNIVHKFINMKKLIFSLVFLGILIISLAMVLKTAESDKEIHGPQIDKNIGLMEITVDQGI